jgi:hypothetical protein
VRRKYSAFRTELIARADIVRKRIFMLSDCAADRANISFEENPAKIVIHTIES